MPLYGWEKQRVIARPSSCSSKKPVVHTNKPKPYIILQNITETYTCEQHMLLLNKNIPYRRDPLDQGHVSSGRQPPMIMSSVDGKLENSAPVYVTLM
jgi:hypothetical protein